MAPANHIFLAPFRRVGPCRAARCALALAVLAGFCGQSAAQAPVAGPPLAPAGAGAAAEPIATPAAPAMPRPFRPIAQLSASARLPAGLLPEDAPPNPDAPALSGNVTPSVGDLRLNQGWGERTYCWSASRLCHGPLYFEEVNLERYGYQCHPALQPFVSGAHFFLTVPTLPYQMTVHPPRECVYTLGHYRPGSRSPWQRSRLPLDARAAAVEAGVAVGLVFLIP